MDSPLTHARKVISLVREQSDEAILFYSGGKDSLALLDMIAPRFNRIVCVFMYFVKGLSHIEKFLSIVNRYQNAELVQVPHFALNTIYREGVYCTPDATIPQSNLKKIRKQVRGLTGIDWVFMGMKQADGLNRRLMLKGYREQAISDASKTAYPLSLWKKSDVLSYLNFRKLPTPIDYGMKTNSSGLVFNEDVFAWLRDNYPIDLEMIYAKFPLSRQILFEYDSKSKQVSDGGGDHSPKRDKERAV